MNRYSYTFTSACPSDGETIIYSLIVETKATIMVERIKDVCAEWPKGFQEEIAYDLESQLKADLDSGTALKLTLEATHQGVHILTTLP